MNPRVRRLRLIIGSAAVACAAALAGFIGLAGSSKVAIARGRIAAVAPSARSPVLRGIHKIRHVVIIMQENRSFDSYFGTYPHADGIPGLAGATPIQNVGAYGQEVSETITGVRVYDRATGDVSQMPNERCGFGYRTSRFRGADRFVVLSVTFDLAVQVLSAPVRYAELAAALGVSAGDQVESTEARSAVIELRQRKGMVIDPADPDTRSVGSFFVNPVLDAPALAAVEAAARARYGPDTRVPRFEVEGSGDGLVKVPAAWLIERAGFAKGYSPGDGARISAKHTLALVNSGSATTAALIALAREIRDGVRDAFGVSLTPEPVLVGIAL